jgi:hypothetical protein
MYGLPQAGILANINLVIHLEKDGYVQSAHTPGLITHKTGPISFCLVVDDIGVKYVGAEPARRLIEVLQRKYTITIDWSGNLYVGFHLHWDYAYRTVNISMPNYVAKALNRFNHAMSISPQHSPHFCATPQNVAKVQLTALVDESPSLTPAQVPQLQQVIVTFVYYAVLVPLGSLATTAMLQHLHQFIGYASTYPDDKVRFTASPMILIIHSDASDLSESQARSCAGGIFYLSSQHNPATLAPTNGSVNITSVIINHVMSSASEAELAALFYIAQDACIIRVTLEELGHPQPPTAI